ncbi:MAG: ATP-dependent DNA helicase RecG [Oligoflexia bacterium]|nr:ATP-dependent DNA helicase RecG [Oligoflexia bacterium]
MPPEVKSATTSSQSRTSKSVSAAFDTDIQYVKGVGPGLGALLKSRGLTTVRDLLYFFPRAYEDRTRILRVAEVKEGEPASVAVTVRSCRQIPLRRTGKRILEVRAGDESGTLSLKWFHAPRGMEARFTVGAQIMVTGTAKRYLGQLEIIHPEISWGVSSSTEHVGRVVPIYTELEGISSRVLRKILWEALEKYATSLTEDLPEVFRSRHSLPRLADAVQTIHFPPDTDIQALIDFKAPSHLRLIYEEFLKFEFLVLRQRLKMQREAAPAFGASGGRQAVNELEKLLPFQLTGDQRRCVEEILKELSEPHPMNRLIQGDVGSGKTAVAFLTAACVLVEGSQAALMAPTEILAEQHFHNAVRLFGGRLNVALLTGKTPGSERTRLLARLASGEPLLLIGTHALLEEPVEFRSLDYILIDEQHRFGVEQRRTLRQKGTRIASDTGQTRFPHTLILTATPIPRTLALTAYGDLVISSIRELPPGRTPVATTIVRERGQRARAYDKIREELRKGHQAYFIYPLVNDSEAEGFTQLKSAVAESERLQREVFPEFKVGLLHGQQRPDEKAAIMDRYKRRELDILVSTTVVEVGVDVPNATIMVVEHAERFGLSQLHQLRGRVGRGSSQSYCFLFAAERTGEATQARLDVLEETNDGFKIAEADLEIRGPGEFLGTRQSGGLPFKLANLVRDQEWLLKARDDAAWLLKNDPDLQLVEHRPLHRFYEREGNLQFERLKTS